MYTREQLKQVTHLSAELTKLYDKLGRHDLADKVSYMFIYDFMGGPHNVDREIRSLNGDQEDFSNMEAD